MKLSMDVPRIKIYGLKTQVGARTIVLDPKTHKVFLPAAELGPKPEPTKEQPHPVPTIVPGTFNILVFGR